MNRKLFFSVALISISLLSVEMVWTRILAAEFFYTFAFLVLSLAILGLGLGSLSLRVFPRFNSPTAVSNSLLLGGLMIIAGPPLVYRLGIKFSELPGDLLMLGKLILVILILSSTFYFCGIGLAILFKRHHQMMQKVYMADLLGAGLGALLALVLMNTISTPVTAFILSIPIFLAAALHSDKVRQIISVSLIILALVAGVNAKLLLKSSKPDRGPVIYEHWDSMAQLKMFSYPGDEARGIVIDNAANTPVYRFDGDFSLPDSGSEDLWGIPAGDIIHQFDSCRFLSLGAGGGADVLQALMEGAAEVHAVEVNPWLNRMLTQGDPEGYLPTYTDSLTSELLTLPKYTNHYYADARVKVVSEDARAFIRRYESRFDLIYSLSSNTFAALASGAFALAENYLFTTEAFQDYWIALSDSGYLMMEHQFYMPRLFSEAIAALTALDIEDPLSHLAVYNLPSMRRKVLLMSKQPLDPDFLQIALRNITKDNFDDIHLLFPAVDSLKNNIYQQISNDGWKQVADSISVDISPNTDNRPFAAQMGLWKNLDFSSDQKLLPYEFRGFPLTKLILVSITLVVILLILPLTMVPYFLKGPKLPIRDYLYFASIGIGFMGIELILMQQYTLLVGPAVYSIAAILISLLVSSGMGSRFSQYFNSQQIFGVIIIWVVLDVLLFNALVSLFGDWQQLWRVFITILLVAPLGFFMGMPFPKGVKRIGELVDWGFAVNGAASVLGSTLTLLMVINYGFSVGLIMTMVMYGSAFFLHKERVP